MALLGVAVYIEQPNHHVAQNGKDYFTFWVRFQFGTEYFAASGWKYFPETRKVTTPSQMKGPNHFFNTTKISAGLLGEISAKADEYFAPILQAMQAQKQEVSVTA